MRSSRERLRDLQTFPRERLGQLRRVAPQRDEAEIRQRDDLVVLSSALAEERDRLLEQWHRRLPVALAHGHVSGGPQRERAHVDRQALSEIET